MVGGSGPNEASTIPAHKAESPAQAQSLALKAEGPSTMAESPVRAQSPFTANIMLLAESMNSMTQRFLVELQGSGHTVRVVTGLKSSEMSQAVTACDPDLIICPFLKTAVPAEVYNKRPCWIVHPGLVGDRGPSSLDWAVQTGQTEWGVTILEASEEMDHGDIWATKNFSVDQNATKSSLYRFQVQECAVDAVFQAIENFASKDFQPRVLNYNDPDVKGKLEPAMKRKDRTIDWSLPAAEIHRIIRSSESSPGAVATFPALTGNHQFGVFHSKIEPDAQLVRWVKSRYEDYYVERAEAGSILARSGGAILIGTQEEEGALWVSHMKPKPGCKMFKNKATNVIPVPEELTISRPGEDENLLDGSPFRDRTWYEVPFGSFPSTFQEIFVWQDPSLNVAYLHLDFFNGAFGSEQCLRAKAAVRQCLRDLKAEAEKRDDGQPPTLVLMGGSQYFGNGIDLNAIEASQCPETASWININAINDFIQSFAEESQVVILAAVRRNAGAGGAMVAAAADYVISNPSVVINPSYKAMHLHGSEYWTYFLPRRVGEEVARRWTENTSPVHAMEAWEKGFVDEMVGTNFDDSTQAIIRFLPSFVSSPRCRHLFERKRHRNEAEFRHQMATARSFELEQMRKSFQNPDYHRSRRDFVYH